MIAAVIAASGYGKRLGYPQGKQFLIVAGEPLLYYSLKSFIDHPEVEMVVAVVNSKDKVETEELIGTFKKEGCKKILDYCFGSHERYGSVYNGILKVKEILKDSFESSIILIHDGARPLVSQELISGVIEGVRKCGACICAVPVVNTIKEVIDGKVFSTPDRSRLYAAQTPQGFTGRIIWESYLKLKEDDFLPTDDSSIVERAGFEVLVVPGSSENIKLTTEKDLALIERMLSRRE